MAEAQLFQQHLSGAVPLERACSDSGNTPLLNLSGVTKRFKSTSGILTALEDIDLSIDAAEFVTLIGPSGCGKSTLLELVAGLEEPSSGTIALSGDVHARRLGHVGYMPQRDLLLPWRRALDNASAGLEVQGVHRRQARKQAAALFRDFGLDGFSRSFPSELSGGMRQRVAFARTVLVSQDLMLLDEPFGALDALTRGGLQTWLQDVWRRLGIACLFVTHDVDEALLLGDRVYALSPRPGRIILERHVPLPRPRRSDMLTSAEMLVLKTQLLEALAGASRLPSPGGTAE
jgi:ABC-type nitrate/sulfonate/bicarbonate transport system ATPase subunit